MNQKFRKLLPQGSCTAGVISLLFTLLTLTFFISCGKGKGGAASLAPDAAKKVYVAPGDKDEVYLFTSGGYSGQLGVYGIPSGRLFKNIPVFSVDPTNGWGFDDESKGMLMTSHGFVPWDDSHHPQLSKTAGEDDGRWIFINGNNTPRIARIGLKSFETEEIIEIPNSAGNHSSPYLTSNTEYLMAGTRFSVPYPQRDIPIENYKKGEFLGAISLIKVDPKEGNMSIDFQVLLPGFNYDLASCGKGPSKDWCFFTTYNTEQAYQMLEIEASKKDKDFILALNWVKAKACADAGNAKAVPANYYHNLKPHNKPAVSTKHTTVRVMHAKDCKGAFYYLPTPKSPHGVDVDPSGENIVGSGKLAATIAVHSFSKFSAAMNDAGNVTGEVLGVPILKYESTLAGEVQKPCLGPLHTEFDSNGYAYTSCFVSSEVVRWKLASREVVQHMPAYYSIGHLSVVGGGSSKPYGKYLVAMNKITKDRFLPVGMELAHSAQLWDISGSTAQLLLDFPTVGEPHYAQMIVASKISDKTDKIYKLEENKHPYAVLKEENAKIVREGKTVHVYMTAIRSHFKPDKVEVKLGDEVYFHVTNLEQDFDIPHGFAVMGNPVPNVLIMPGQTRTVRYTADKVGVYPFYCTDFCSALHQEMQQYIRVSP